VLGIHYAHSNLKRTIEDFSAFVDGHNIYRIGNPGEGTSLIYPASYPTTKNFAMPKPERQYDALELTANKRLSNNWFASGSYTYSRLYGNYAGLANSDEISTPTTGASSSTAQQQSGSIGRPGSNSHTAWDSDLALWDAHGHLNPLGRLATDRPHVVKLYAGYAMPVGTEIGLSFYGGSGTPVTTIVNEGATLSSLQVNGRGDMGRTPFLSKTDLLVSHQFTLAEGRQVRVAFQVLNVFNQKTATHIFPFLNKGAPGGAAVLPQDAVDLSRVDLAKGYDYKALILASQEGALAFDPRYGKKDLWATGTQGQFSVTYVF
jgi:hypothetical protein